MNSQISYIGLITALSTGLLIGTVRERLHRPGPMKAGVRTHAIVALLGAITFDMGPNFFIAALLVTGLMVAVGYHQAAHSSKLLLAYLSGGKNYGAKVSLGLGLGLCAAITGMLVMD